MTVEFFESSNEGILVGIEKTGNEDHVYLLPAVYNMGIAPEMKIVETTAILCNIGQLRCSCLSLIFFRVPSRLPLEMKSYSD